MHVKVLLCGDKEELAKVYMTGKKIFFHPKS